jgi:hypothetical protein
MKRLLLAALALIFVIGFQPQSAHAQNNTPSWAQSWSGLWYLISHGQDPRLVYSGWVVGAGTGVASYLATEKHGNPGVRHWSYGTAYGVTTAGCMVVYPIVATLWVNRPLTPREAYTGFGDCIVPLVGGWLVDMALPHTPWIDGTPPKPVRHAKK